MRSKRPIASAGCRSLRFSDELLFKERLYRLPLGTLGNLVVQPRSLRKRPRGKGEKVVYVIPAAWRDTTSTIARLVLVAYIIRHARQIGR